MERKYHPKKIHLGSTLLGLIDRIGKFPSGVDRALAMRQLAITEEDIADAIRGHATTRGIDGTISERNPAP